MHPYRMPWWMAALYLLAGAIAFSVAYMLGQLIFHGHVTLW